ncbi:TPR-like protein [Hesseltinella vesiculosa]|uniref:TPR-like protein n=1 Tax=Hesseltinella vesiculosa TaxID=101127 RepID=A0A1X2G3J2_9FUNG|nr:TPR-like protein [Hesseltinella vesiculosa]
MQTAQEKYDKGIELRLAGNESYKAGDYKQALTNYYHAVLHLRTVGGQNQKDEFSDLSNKQLLMIYNNMAAVHVKQENWKRAKDCARDALKLDGSNLKAKFRLAQGYLRTNDLSEAKTLLDEVLAADPNDAMVKQELARYHRLTKSTEGHEKQVYRNMMKKMMEETDAEQA